MNKPRLWRFSIIMLIFGISCDSPKESRIEPNYDSLDIVLNEVYITDQIVRGGDVVDSETSISRLYNYDMQLVDAHNQDILIGIVEKYGWLPREKISSNAAAAMFLVLQHAPLPLMMNYFPLLKVSEGLTSSVAMMEDRMLMYQLKKQIYGTQATTLTRGDGSMTIWPIEDPKNVNKRREGLFDMTIEEYALRLSADYDPNEGLPDFDPWGYTQ